MKFAATTTIPFRRIKVKSNTNDTKKAQWMTIEDAGTGKVLHTGRPNYIKRVAAKRYGSLVT